MIDFGFEMDSSRASILRHFKNLFYVNLSSQVAEVLVLVLVFVLVLVLVRF